MLMKRFLDKSAFCRTRVIKAFFKLTEENKMPRPLYFELFTNVIARMRDSAIFVRKGALRLFMQLVRIYGLIFNVDLRDP